MLNWPKKQPEKKWERVPTRYTTYEEFFERVKGFDDKPTSPMIFNMRGLASREAKEAQIYYFDKWVWGGDPVDKKMAEFFEEYLNDPRNPTNFWKQLAKDYGNIVPTQRQKALFNKVYKK